MLDLLDLISRDIPLKRTSAHGGGEYSGPCPLCRRGTDRFKVWPQRERWACLGRKAGRAGCDRGGDAIQYLRERDGLTYREACARLNIDLDAKTQRCKDAKNRLEDSFAPLRLCAKDDSLSAPPLCLCGEAPSSPPDATWQARARGWAADCEAQLWQPQGAAALAYLRGRGLDEEVLRAFHVGYNPCDCREAHSRWGLTRSAESAQHIWIPRGITFPWFSGGAIWRFNVRRPLTAAQRARGEAKYIGPAGFANALYNADALADLSDAEEEPPPNRFQPVSHAPAPGFNRRRPRQPVILVEGEIDALTIVQAYRDECGRAGGEQVAAVATGSTGGGRRGPWIRTLAAAPLVLLAFDNDDSDKSDRDGSAPDAPDAPDALGAGDKAAALVVQQAAQRPALASAPARRKHAPQRRRRARLAGPRLGVQRAPGMKDTA